jgi:hypothetical protein
MVSECNLKLIIFTSVGMGVPRVTCDRLQLSTVLVKVLCSLLVMCTPEWCLQISALITMGDG